MHTEIQIAPNFYYLGGSDRRIAKFENVYPVPLGASYNCYLYIDEKTVLLDTIEAELSKGFYENLDYLLDGRKLDYLIINHMEPDHAANIGEVLLRHPETTLVMGAMAKKFLLNYFPNLKAEVLVVKEGDTLSIGKHQFTFVMAPMVHWPEVMFTYEMTEKTLFSADAFGAFGALSGPIYANKQNFDLAEARRYYTNIVGKYGDQVTAVLQKAAKLDIQLICPLHGPIHKDDIGDLLKVYTLWASYTPEDKEGVMIVYSSVYGNTANAAMALAVAIAKQGVENLVMYDVSKTDASYLIAESFRVNTIALVATTYNMGVFIEMENFLHDFANHKIRNRDIAFMENGSWAPAAKANMKKILEGLPLRYIEKEITMASTLKEEQMGDLEALAAQIAATVGK
ncbi:MAG: MBL fold metallo-hydrolase [Bacilli bacterium]|nr:MBL fold metallo-hydrolase [Bacilli bacterium]